jgi:hypothetical protein
MRFEELPVFGVYISPFSAMMVGAWIVTIGLRRVASRLGLIDQVWHPALFVFAIYIIVLATITLIVAH